MLFLSIGKKEMSPFARHDNDGVGRPRFAKQDKVRAVNSIPQARNPLAFSLVETIGVFIKQHISAKSFEIF
jgi:hypothetical protein